MRCPIIVGREGLLSLLASAVRRLRAEGRGGALVLMGEAGVGKTRLAEHAREAAGKAGIVTVTDRALPEAADGSLRPVAEALLALTRDRPAPEDEDLAPYAAVIASLVPHWRGTGMVGTGGAGGGDGRGHPPGTALGQRRGRGRADLGGSSLV